jgi:hypothetical protein
MDVDVSRATREITNTTVVTKATIVPTIIVAIM